MGIVRFDHAVLLAHDEARARAFYLDLLDAEVTKTFMRPLKGKDCHRSFLRLGDHGHVIGLFEDPFEVPPPRTAREWPAVVFSVPAHRFERVVETSDGVLEACDIPGFSPTFYTHDTEGNAIGLTVTKSESPQLVRLELDCPDIQEGIDFYGDVFAMGTPETGKLSGGEPFAWWRLDDAGGGLLSVAHADAPGANPGQHYAFLVTPDAEHHALKAQLSERGIEEAPGRPGERNEGEISTYVRDPWGRKLQWTTPVDV
ncbi:VOC family protein [Egicoccus sp. AB-alg6-2]|uniref:VOC family protein n=1 Tax=Egicoccus sp. AB-alg6-2 TaxID=3242692 RepID=UPI00359DB828